MEGEDGRESGGNAPLNAVSSLDRHNRYNRSNVYKQSKQEKKISLARMI